MDYITDTKGFVRWDPARFIAYRDGCFDPLNSYMLEAVMTLPVAGKYRVLDDVNRPDMISAAIYGNDCQYWWLLLLFNSLWDYSPTSFFSLIPQGTTINYFSIDDLERVYFGLRALQIANPT